MPDVLREAATVVVVGAGVAGTTAANLLQRCGIDCIVLERQSREYVEQRQRAGVVEYRGARMFGEWGLAEQLLGGFPADSTLEVRVHGARHLLLTDELSKRCAWQLCPQQVLLRNLIDAFLGGGGDLRFQAADVALHGLAAGRPSVTYVDAAGERHEIACSFVAGCDGDHGVSRSSVPDSALTSYTIDYGIAWLTVLALAPPPPYPLMAVSDRGFAAHFARGPQASRFYLQCARGDQAHHWPGDRIWHELRARLSCDGLPAGEITGREVFALRGAVYEPMSHGRLYLLGDAAHIVSPIGGKGMNMALYDAEVFAGAVRDFVRDGDEAGLRSYSEVCLRRVWAYQEFARWLTETLHEPGDRARVGAFRAKLATARLQRWLSSQAAARDIAELFAGLG